MFCDPYNYLEIRLYVEPTDWKHESFDANDENFPCSAEEYMLANNITDKKPKTAVFMTLVGGKTYNLLRDLASPAKPAELKFSEIIDLQQKGTSFTNVVNENVTDHLAALRKCAEYCNFGVFLQQALSTRPFCVWT